MVPLIGPLDELEAGPDLVVLTSTGELMGLTTCRDAVYGDGKSSSGCRDGFIISSSSFSRILLSASNNLSGEFIMTSRSFCPIYFSECILWKALLSNSGASLLRFNLFQIDDSHVKTSAPKHQSNFDPPFSQFSHVWIESNTNCLWCLIDKSALLPRFLSHFTTDFTHKFIVSQEWLNFFWKILGQNHCVGSLRQQWDFLDFSTWNIVPRWQFMGLCFGITSFLEHCCDSRKIIQVWNSPRKLLD